MEAVPPMCTMIGHLHTGIVKDETVQEEEPNDPDIFVLGIDNGMKIDEVPLI